MGKKQGYREWEFNEGSDENRREEGRHGKAANAGRTRLQRGVELVNQERSKAKRGACSLVFWFMAMSGYARCTQPSSSNLPPKPKPW